MVLSASKYSGFNSAIVKEAQLASLTLSLPEDKKACLCVSTTPHCQLKHPYKYTDKGSKLYQIA